MSIHCQTVGPVEIVALPRRLVMANAAEIRSAINTLVDSGRHRLILDLGGVEFVDSSGLSILITALKSVQPHAGNVVLLSPSETVRSLIELTRLHQVFEIFEDRGAAVQRLS